MTCKRLLKSSESLLCSGIFTTIVIASATSVAHAQKRGQARSEYSIDHISSWGGAVNDFVRVGDIGYCGSGERLVILDMTDLDNLVELGSVRLGSMVNDIAVRNNRAYVVTGSAWSGCYLASQQSDAGISLSGLHVVDVSIPNHPVLMWSNPPIPCPGCCLRNEPVLYGWDAIDLYGNIAFLQDGGDVTFANLSNPDAPIVFPYDLNLFFEDGLGGGLYGWQMKIQSMVIEGDLLYIVFPEYGFGTARFRIYDLSNVNPNVLPVAPPLVGALNLGPAAATEPMELTVEGGRAYISGTARIPLTGASRVVVWTVDCTNPAAPIETSEIDGFAVSPSGSIMPLSDLHVSGDRLYVAGYIDGAGGLGNYDRADGLVIYDVASNPGHPIEIGRFKAHSVWHLAVVGDGNTVYVCDRGEGLIVVNATDPQNPVRRGGFHSPATLREIDKRGDLLYVSDEINGFSILDVSDPTHPELVGIYQVPGGVGYEYRGMAIDSEGYAYLAAGDDRLEIIDVSNPAKPVLAGQISIGTNNGWSSATVFIEENLVNGTKIAYLGKSGRLCSLDVTNPTGIVQLDCEVLGGSALPSLIAPIEQGLFYFVADGGVVQPVRAMDTSVATNLIATTFDLGLSAKAIHFEPSRDLLWVVTKGTVNDGGGLRVFDASNPLDPLPIGSLIPLQHPGAVAHHPFGTIVPATAEVQLGEASLNRLLLFDSDNPAAPSLVASRVLPQRTTNAFILGNDLHVDSTGIYLTIGIAARGKNTGLLIFDVEGPPCFADLTGSSAGGPDGAVDVFDLFILLANWNGAGLGADLAPPVNIVDVSDLNALLGQWGSCN